jgi:hypothetical protein
MEGFTLKKLSVSEAIRAMALLKRRTYRLRRGVGVYDEIYCINGKFSIKEKFAERAIETDMLPLAWLDGDNWILERHV